jgi:hypothetical protein
MFANRKIARVNGNENRRFGTVCRRTLLVLSSLLLLAAFFAAPFTSNVMADNKKKIDFCDGTMQSNPRPFNYYGSVGFRFEIPEGFKLDQFDLLACPTWGERANAGFTADIYPWKGSYKESVTGYPLDSCVITQHRDNAGITLTYDYVPAGEYLIHIYKFTDTIGTWEFVALPEQYASTWAYYQDGVEEIEYLPGTSMVVSFDKNPHEVYPRTPAPTEEPAGDGAEDEQATDVPVHTRERITEEPKEAADEKRSGAGGIIAGTAVALLAVAATLVTIGIIVRKDKKDANV